MTLLSRAEDIWVLKPTQEDLKVGASYAAITLPWTFNRMMKNTSVGGQLERGINIAKGIVAQEILRRALQERGVNAQAQRKSYRDDDLFDFIISRNGSSLKLDIKSVNYYRDYEPFGRKPLTPNLIIKNAGYFGPDWRSFFPMLVPHTQIRQDKEAYCFAIADSIDFRRSVETGRSTYAITTYPYGEPMAFLSHKNLCLEREHARKGIYLKIAYRAGTLFELSEPLSLYVLGEWDGKAVNRKFEVRANESIDLIGPFSCVSAFQVDIEDYKRFSGEIEVTVVRNDLTKPVYNARKINVNELPLGALRYTKSDFCNLILPDEYRLFVIGWITKDEFLQKCRSYTGWVWPEDRISKYENQLWSQITEKDRKNLIKAGFEDAIQKKPTRVNAGWLKTTGRGGGACCYYFPNIGYNGGVRETNLYVLPQDLTIMDELGK